ncbi:MAG TPA: 7-carboxy-7-deazaguanine synthase QueE [Candidatus Glassbacteria bacterium]|nr:7-carboxy-7-deazaguanine synthase QueE [Candidatus Glassbacteria bacterium]
MNQFRVCETFVSIAGESGWQGLVSTFIRFSGCDVDCEWCDTAYAREEEGTPVGLDELMSICRTYGTRRVVLTGGEPLLQDGLPELCRLLLEEGFDVQVETSGTRLADKLDSRVMKVMDIKPPSAHAEKSFHWGNLDRLGKRDEIKFLVADRQDYEWALSIMQKCKLESRCRVLFSAVNGRLDPATLADWMVKDALTARLQVQLHKVLWPKDNRGK